MTRGAVRGDAGFSLVEVLVTVAIVGIVFVVFVGGMGTSLIASDRHRKLAVTQAGIRNFAEAVKAAPFSTDCANIVAKYRAAYSPPPPTRRSTAATFASTMTNVVARSVTPPARNTRLLAFFAVTTGTALSQPSGMAAKWVVKSQSATNHVTVGFFDQTLATTAPSGPRTSISTPPAAESIAQLVSLESATPATAAPVPRPQPSIKNTLGAGASEISITSPPGTAVGDAMIAQIAVRGAGTLVSPPTGWTLVVASVGASLKSFIYERTAVTADATSFRWTFSGITDAAGGIMSYTGASKGYTATVAPNGSPIQYWDATAAAFTTTCPAPENNALQLVPLRLESSDGNAVETSEIVKRCHERPTATSICADTA